MRVTVLGCGTSTGVPVPGCACAVCSSDDPLNRRLRVSALLEIQAKDIPQSVDIAPLEVVGRVLIDTSTDLRQQAIRYDIRRIDAVLYTHTHADHIFGLDDLRSFNFMTQIVIPLYATAPNIEELRRTFRYVFSPDPTYKGGSPPQVTVHEINFFQPFQLMGVEILPLPIKHGPLDVTGFRVGSFAYLTDCSFIPPETIELLQGLEILVLDGLRFRPHPTHFTIQQAVEQIEIIKPKYAYLTHLSHDVDYHRAVAEIKAQSKLNILPAYDGLRFEL